MTVDVGGQAAARKTAAEFNRGFYGARPLTDRERYTPSFQGSNERAASEARWRTETALILDKYSLSANSAELDVLRRAAPCKAIRAIFAAAEPRPNSQAEVSFESGPIYSILTPFFEHRTFFKFCAGSVAALVEADSERNCANRIEWIIVNDDPNIDAATLKSLVPETLLPFVRILSDGANKGISVRLNEAADTARGKWLLMLDCDDQIEPEAATVIDHYASVFPEVRYMSSSMIDIDEDGIVLRFNQLEWDSTFLFERGMTAGHLVAIRRDLFEEQNGYREAFSGCQDYDFALRVAREEPLLSLPEYLYRYRWHQSSQSVGRQQLQGRRTIDVLRAYLGWFANINRGQSKSAPAPVGMGHCIIRTQGKRLDLLAETLESVLWQTIKIEPVVVVHGDEAVQANIRADLSGRGFAALVLGAPNTKRRRGHPMNVALDYLRFSAPDEDFFFFLDDDDIIYPFFAERLTTLLELKRADVAVATGSKRVPWEAPEQGHQLLPVSSLVAGNFIPINCYMARVGALRRSGARCREDMDYLEDWDFLLGLLGSGARFHFIGDVLSEFRIFSDGNTRVKRDPKHYRDCADRVMARSRSIAKRLGISTLSRDLAEFDFSIRAEMTPSEIHQLLFASSLFDGKSVS